MNYTALARFIGYLAAVLLGGFMIVWGVIHQDMATVTAGIALVGAGGVASANTPVKAPDPIDDAGDLGIPATAAALPSAVVTEQAGLSRAAAARARRAARPAPPTA